MQTTVQFNPNLEVPTVKGAVIGRAIATFDGNTVGETLLVTQLEIECSGLLLRARQRITSLFDERSPSGRIGTGQGTKHVDDVLTARSPARVTRLGPLDLTTAPHRAPAYKPAGPVPTHP